MEVVVILLVALLALDLASWQWGADSTDGINNPEGDQRRAWRG